MKNLQKALIQLGKMADNEPAFLLSPEQARAVLDELERQRARIAELNAKMETVNMWESFWRGEEPT